MNFIINSKTVDTGMLGIPYIQFGTTSRKTILSFPDTGLYRVNTRRFDESYIFIEDTVIKDSPNEMSYGI